MDIVKEVYKWANNKKINEDVNEAYIKLVRAHCSPSLAYKLVKGTYKHKPKQLVISAIKEAMGK